MVSKLDNRQSRQRTVLDQVSNSTNLKLDNILNLINDELTMPLRMRASATPNQVLNIDAISIQTNDAGEGHGRRRTIPPISNELPNFTGATITFPTISGGNITTSGVFSGGPYTLTVASGSWIKCMVSITSTGSIALTFGTQGASESAASIPGTIPNSFAIGFVALQNISGVIQTVTNSRIYQFVGGGGGGGSGGTTDLITQNSHNFNVGNVLYLNGSSYTKARSDAVNTAEVVGVVSRIIDINQFELTLYGEVTGLSGLIPGEVYFLSPTTDGAITVTEPSVVGQISLPIGVASSATSLYVAPKRGIVVGATNVRTQVPLQGGSTGGPFTTNVQDVSAYEAGELTGWIQIGATTSLKFYVSAQFAKNGAGTDHNISYQTTGDVPPVGFSMTITTAGVIQVTMPSITGFGSASINYGLNVASVGVTLPLSINGNVIVDGTVTAAKLAANSVTTSKIVASAVGNSQLATDSVTADKIAANAVGTSELANDSVTADKIATGAVGTTEINTSATPTVNTIYTNNWFRSYNDTGWYNETYQGGINMTDSTWIRTYGGKNFYCSGEIRAGNGFSFNDNPGGGGGDSARIFYYADGGENTTLRLQVNNDPGDVIELSAPGNSGQLGGFLRVGRRGSNDIYAIGQVMQFWYGTFPNYRFLSLQSDGNMVIYDQNNQARWSAGTSSSDIRFKKDVEDFNKSGIDLIKKLNVIEFNYIDGFLDDNIRRVGFSAQDVEKIIPQATQLLGPDEQNKSYALHKEEIVPFLVKAVQEQQEIIENQNKKIEILEERLKRLEDAINKGA